MALEVMLGGAKLQFEVLLEGSVVEFEGFVRQAEHRCMSYCSNLVIINIMECHMPKHCLVAFNRSSAGVRSDVPLNFLPSSLPSHTCQMPFFEQARSLGVHGGVFNDIQGHQNIIHMHNINLGALNHATEQFPYVEQHRSVLKALLDDLAKLVLETDRQRSQSPLTAMEVEDVNRSKASLCERCREADYALLQQRLQTRR